MPESSDPCAEVAELRKAYEALVKGENTTLVRLAGEEIRYGSGNLEELKRLIAAKEDACALTMGKKPKRRRYAMRSRARPY